MYIYNIIFGRISTLEIIFQKNIRFVEVWKNQFQIKNCVNFSKDINIKRSVFKYKLFQFMTWIRHQRRLNITKCIVTIKRDGESDNIFWHFFDVTVSIESSKTAILGFEFETLNLMNYLAISLKFLRRRKTYITESGLHIEIEVELSFRELFTTLQTNFLRKHHSQRKYVSM